MICFDDHTGNILPLCMPKRKKVAPSLRLTTISAGIVNPLLTGYKPGLQRQRTKENGIWSNVSGICWRIPTPRNSSRCGSSHRTKASELLVLMGCSGHLHRTRCEQPWVSL